jgi:two-component system response regulator YesN
MRAAKEMLLEGKLVYEISELLGYESAFYFSKVFKKREGISPREFLRRQEKASLGSREWGVGSRAKIPSAARFRGRAAE